MTHVHVRCKTYFLTAQSISLIFALVRKIPMVNVLNRESVCHGRHSRLEIQGQVQWGIHCEIPQIGLSGLISTAISPLVQLRRLRMFTNSRRHFENIT